MLFTSAQISSLLCVRARRAPVCVCVCEPKPFANRFECTRTLHERTHLRRRQRSFIPFSYLHIFISFRLLHIELYTTQCTHRFGFLGGTNPAFVSNYLNGCNSSVHPVKALKSITPSHMCVHVCMERQSRMPTHLPSSACSVGDAQGANTATKRESSIKNPFSNAHAGPYGVDHQRQRLVPCTLINYIAIRWIVAGRT